MKFTDAADALLHMGQLNSIVDCLDDDGYIDATRYMEMMADIVGDDFDETATELLDELEPSNDPPSTASKKRKKRQKRILLARRNADGKLEAIPATESCWYH